MKFHGFNVSSMLYTAIIECIRAREVRICIKMCIKWKFNQIIKNGNEIIFNFHKYVKM